MEVITTEALQLRIRSRIMEHLQLMSSADLQLTYQRSAPHVRVANELFNGWEDWVPDQSAVERLTLPIFSRTEQAAVLEFLQVINAIDARTPRDLPDIKAFIQTREWADLSAAACRALAIFQLRGATDDT